jgi:hypothetical protein
LFLRSFQLPVLERVFLEALEFFMDEFDDLLEGILVGPCMRPPDRYRCRRKIGVNRIG